MSRMYKDTMAHTRRYKDFYKRGLETECTERRDSQIEGLCYTISHTPSHFQKTSQTTEPPPSFVPAVPCLSR